MIEGYEWRNFRGPRFLHAFENPFVQRLAQFSVPEEARTPNGTYSIRDDACVRHVKCTRAQRRARCESVYTRKRGHCPVIGLGFLGIVEASGPDATSTGGVPSQGELLAGSIPGFADTLAGAAFVAATAPFTGIGAIRRRR